jgi:exodeoxyribonuclease V alpha subunit
MVDASPVQDRPRRELRGVVERNTYQDPENGYTVARLAPERPESEAEAARGDDRLVTVLDTLADLTPGEATVASGWWRNNPKHDWQFQTRGSCTGLPETCRRVGRYVGRDRIGGRPHRRTVGRYPGNRPGHDPRVRARAR